MSMLNEYFTLYSRYSKEYGDKTILLFQVGAFFEVYTKVDLITQEVKDTNIIEYKKCTEIGRAHV